VDYETPVWLDREFADIRSWLAFHTGAPIATDYRDTRFAVMSGQSSLPKITDFPLGEDRYPDLSATLIVICSSLEGGATIRLTGPGVETERVISPQGLHDQFWIHQRDNHALYPLGCDVILVAGSQLLALPRSVKSVEVN
jgi:alpha-D-ribose 1-methylphosphonate 5-triphosphate synthase subunit PhnH